MKFISPHKDGTIIDIYVSPKSAKTFIKGIRSDRLWVALRAVPENGKANDELIKFLADLLKTAPSNISIISGLTGRNKRVFIRSINPNIISKPLSALLITR